MLNGKINVLLIAMSVIFVSCGWKADGPEYLMDAYGTSCSKDTGTTNNQTNDTQVSSKPAASIAGRWAMQVDQHGTIAPVGQDWDLYLKDLVIAEIPPDGSGIYITFCDQLMHVTTPQFDPNDPTKENPLKPQSYIGQALKDAMVSVWLPFEKPALDALPKMDVLFTWGLKNMKKPLTDKLPDKPDDPRVWDQDADGHPGVTIVVTKPVKGDRYMVRRGLWNLSQGTPDPDFLWIQGTLKFKIDQVALGATETLLMTVAPVTPKSENTYTMRRVPENFTCQDLLSHVDTVFADPPAVTK